MNIQKIDATTSGYGRTYLGGAPKPTGIINPVAVESENVAQERDLISAAKTDDSPSMVLRQVTGGGQKVVRYGAPEDSESKVVRVPVQDTNTDYYVKADKVDLGQVMAGDYVQWGSNKYRVLYADNDQPALRPVPPIAPQGPATPVLDPQLVRMIANLTPPQRAQLISLLKAMETNGSR